MKVEISIRQSVVPDALIRALSPEARMELHAAGTDAVVEMLQAHVRSYAGSKHGTAMAFGASPTRHYEDGAAAISGVASADEGTVTIPARSGGSEVYGKTVATLRAHGWKFASGRKGTPQEKLLFGRFGDEKESKVMFILKESVTQRRDPSLLPSQDAIADCAGKAVVRRVLDAVRKARRSA